MVCATSISGSITRDARFSWRRAVGILVLLAGCHDLVAAETNRPPGSTQAVTNLAGYFQQVFRDASAQFLADPNNSTNAWQFGRACFDLAELATNNSVKAEIAEQGIATCRRATTLQPDSAPAHYYLGMTIGQLADTKRNLGALKMVKEMEREFLTARQLDAHYDFAGPDRNLGLLYLQAPAMISIGSRSKARHHLKLAVQLAPDFPENRLNLIESMLKTGDYDDAQRELKALEKLWPAAKTKFTGPLWAPSLVDWQRRIEDAKKKIGNASK